MKNAVASIISGLVLIVSGAANAEEFNLSPQTFQQHAVFHNHDQDNCGNFFAELPTTGLRSRGLRMEFFMNNLPGFNQYLVGFENRLDKGADPAPCNRVYQEAIELALMFDISRVQAHLDRNGRDQSVSALLTWEPRTFTFPREGTTFQNRPYKSCRGSGFGFGRLVDSWRPGYVDRRIPAPSNRVDRGRLGERGDIRGRRMNADMRMQPSTAPVQEQPPRAHNSSRPYPFRIQLDVTDIVTSWLATSRLDDPALNRGIVLSPHAGPAFLSRFNEVELVRNLDFKLLHCWTVVKEPRLKILVGE